MTLPPDDQFANLVRGAGSATLSEAAINMMARAAGIPTERPAEAPRGLRSIIERSILGRTATSGSIRAAYMVHQAGYRKRTVLTEKDELQLLPIKAVIRSDAGYVYERVVGGWALTGHPDQHSTNRNWLPATVLYDPSEES